MIINSNIHIYYYDILKISVDCIDNRHYWSTVLLLLLLYCAKLKVIKQDVCRIKQYKINFNK